MLLNQDRIGSKYMGYKRVSRIEVPINEAREIPRENPKSLIR